MYKKMLTSKGEQVASGTLCGKDGHRVRAIGAVDAEGTWHDAAARIGGGIFVAGCVGGENVLLMQFLHT